MIMSALIEALRTKQLWKIRGAGSLALHFLSDYRRRGYSWFKVFAIHRRGFSVGDWKAIGLTKENYKDYLSTKDYYRIHPINGQYSHWIDDKLTLKYMFAGGGLERYMPAYYFQISAAGKLMRLMDSPPGQSAPVWEDVAELLREKKLLAIKTAAGSLGRGFYKAEYKNGQYILNGTAGDEETFCNSIRKLKDYIIIEYLKPHAELAQFCSATPNTIRFLLGRVDGKLTMMKSFIRFGTTGAGVVENYNSGGILCYLNENGEFFNGNVLQGNRNAVVSVHPDTGRKLAGRVPLWDDIVTLGELVDRYFPQLDYIGLDVVVTDKNEIKVLEINSLTSLDAIQLDCSLFEYDWSKFYREKIAMAKK